MKITKLFFLLMCCALFSSAQNVGVDVPTPLEKLDVAGGIRVGNTSNTNAGTIRFVSPNFQGYDGTQWINFGGGTVTGSGTATRVAFWNGTGSLSSSANLFWDNTNNRLGIGTITPSGPIDVQTPTSGRYMRYHNFGNLSLYNPTGGFIGELRLGEGYGRPGLHSSERLELQSESIGIIFSNSNTERMRLTAAGSLGIGTASPSSILDVVNTSTSSYPTGDAKVRVRTNSASSFARFWSENDLGNFTMQGLGSSAVTVTSHVANAGFLYTSSGVGFQSYHVNKPTGYHAFEIGTGNDNPNNYTEMMRINSTGVGIGATSLTYKLEVSGSDLLSLRLAAPASPLLKLSGSYNSGNGAEFWQDNAGDARININSSLNAIYMKASGDIGIGIAFPATPAARLDVNNGTSTVPIFLARDNGTEVMRIADGGNVGIGGITSPAAYLDITGTNAGTNSLQLRSGNTGNGTTSNQLLFSFNGTSDYRHAIKTRHNSLGVANNSIDFYVWNQASDGAGTVGTKHVMTVAGDNSGSVGIGTTSPTAKLDVAGTVKATSLSGAFDQSASGYTRIGNMQIAWGTATLASGESWTNAGDLSYVLASQSITFPASFNTAPVVTFSQIDGQIAARSAYITYHQPSTTGVSSIYLASPDPAHGNTTGVVVHWTAIGTWQ